MRQGVSGRPVDVAVPRKRSWRGCDVDMVGCMKYKRVMRYVLKRAATVIKLRRLVEMMNDGHGGG